jgi:GxxExxY protein
MEYKYSDITEKIIRAAMNVHSELGNGFQEVIYQRALEVELSLLELKFAREVSMPVFYKGVQVGERRVDFLIENKISVELKALIKLENVHLAQGKNYLDAFNPEVGLLINFGANSLEVKRLFNQKFVPLSQKSIISKVS